MYTVDALIDLVKQEIDERTFDNRPEEVEALNDILSKLQQDSNFDVNEVIWLADLVKIKTELDLE